MEDKSYESFKQKLKSGSAPLHIQEVVSGEEINDTRPEKRNDRNKEEINQESRQLNVEVSEQIFIRLKTRQSKKELPLGN